MADAKCIAAILERAPHLSEKEAAALDDQLAAFRSAQEKSGALDPDGAVLAEARRLGDLAMAAAAIEKRNAAINAARDADWQGFKGRFKSDAEALHAKIAGIQRAVPGGAFSVDAQARAIEASLVGPLQGELRAIGAEKILNADPALERDLAREMARAAGDKNVAATGNRQAEKIAAILVKYLETARLTMNRAGAWIGKLEGYIVRQSHDQFKIRKAGFDKWLADIEPRLHEKTFEDVGLGGDARRAYLESVYTNLSTGNHLKLDQVGDPKDPAFRGPGNLAKRLSQGRELIFRSPDAWLDYNRAYGQGSLAEAVFAQLGRAADATALMREFGTNPQFMFEAWRDRAIVDAKKLGPDAAAREIARLNSWRLRAEFDDVAGASRIPGNATLARWGSIGRAVETLSKLGGVVLSSIPDIGARAATLRHSGVDLLNTYARSFEGHAALLGSDAAKREMADLMGVATDGMRGTVLSRFQAGDSAPGRMSKLMQIFFRANLLQFWTDGHKAGVGFMLARHLADHQGKAFDALPEALRANLARYDIDAKGWDAIRASGARASRDERFLTPDLVDDPELSLRLRTFITDQVAEALNEPTAGTRAITNFGSRPGTPIGEALRFFMQFKQFPVTFAMRQFGREIARGGRPDIFGIAHLIVASTLLGYAALYAKDAAKGLTPRDPLDAEHGWKTFLAAMKQGGGLGIYGDFLFGEYNRFGGGFLETAAGPAAGSLSQVARVLGAIRDGQDPSAKALKLGVDHLPFANVFYLRPVLDWAIVYQLQELANPGYLRRMEQRRARDNDQQFIVSPSRTIPRGGGLRPFEGVRQ